MHGHLIHIGFPKCGSTFLQQWFSQNPHLLYSPGGLASFYNVYQISHLAAMDKADSFKYYVTSDESLSTPRLSTGTIPTDRATNSTKLRPVEQAQKNACDILKSIYPKSKILFVTRGFKGAITSGYSQYIREGGVLTLPKLTRVSLAQMEKETIDEEDGGGFNYTFIANQYEDAFGKNNVLTLPFELLRDNQKWFLSIIENWLDIPNTDISIGRINESLSPHELYWYPRISALVAKGRNFVGNRIYNRFYKWYIHKVFDNKLSKLIKILSRFKPDAAFSNAEVLPEILDYYRRNNQQRCAAIFRDNPLYEPYKSEYLLD